MLASGGGGFWVLQRVKYVTTIFFLKNQQQII